MKGYIEHLQSQIEYWQMISLAEREKNTKLEEILTKYNFNLNTRAEEIPLEVFVELANNLN